MMTDNEIIKALECSPLNDIGGCRKIDVLNLINSQKAEIDRYKINLPHLEQQDEDFCGVLCDFAEELIGKAKSEAIKHFAERLKIFVIPQKADGYTREIVLKSNIDNLVKEMTEAK